MYNVYITYKNNADDVGKVKGYNKIDIVSVSTNFIMIIHNKKIETLYFDKIDRIEIIDEELDNIEYEQERE